MNSAKVRDYLRLTFRHAPLKDDYGNIALRLNERPRERPRALRIWMVYSE
jgi:hypothetical protein